MRRLFVASITLVILCTISTASRGEEFVPGTSWLELSESDRLGWMWGFTLGQEVILEELQLKSTSHLKYLIPVDDAKTISEIITQYYNDAANSYIPWK